MKNDVSITLRISKKDKEVLDTLAKLNNMSLSRIIRELITDYMLYISQQPEGGEEDDDK